MSEQATQEPPKIVDLRFRIGYKKHELPAILPYSVRAIEEFIAAGDFPKGFRPTPHGHTVYDRRDIEAWWAEKRKAWFPA